MLTDNCQADLEGPKQKASCFEEPCEPMKLELARQKEKLLLEYVQPFRFLSYNTMLWCSFREISIFQLQEADSPHIYSNWLSGLGRLVH
jgi:hypothetical protein